jgi:hypothetical protein
MDGGEAPVEADDAQEARMGAARAEAIEERHGRLVPLSPRCHLEEVARLRSVASARGRGPREEAAGAS